MNIIHPNIFNYDFEVVSAVCKSGAIAKETLGLTEEHKIYQGQEETICNPVFQAKVLNSEKTDFNLLLGIEIQLNRHWKNRANSSPDLVPQIVECAVTKNSNYITVFILSQNLFIGSIITCTFTF
ncbi:MAG: DUF1847 domain-containing protein [Desulfobacula sp.]|nr:DUF1847 domain-containing protein [Desulfobacula sp.]